MENGFQSPFSAIDTKVYILVMEFWGKYKGDNSIEREAVENDCCLDINTDLSVCLAAQVYEMYCSRTA